MATDEFRESWRGYLEATRDRPAHPLFDLLDPYLPDAGRAIDLGCGTGRGTLRLLQRGLHVTATDISEDAIEMTRERLPADARAELVCSSFSDLELKRYDVAVACYTLFFMPPDEHARFWARLVDAIEPGGLFAGQFLGDRDDWADKGYTTHARAEVDVLLKPFEVLHLDEEDADGGTATGDTKHWHVFHVIARKR